MITAPSPNRQRNPVGRPLAAMAVSLSNSFRLKIRWSDHAEGELPDAAPLHGPDVADALVPGSGPLVLAFVVEGTQVAAVEG